MTTTREAHLDPAHAPFAVPAVQLGSTDVVGEPRTLASPERAFLSETVVENV